MGFVADVLWVALLLLTCVFALNGIALGIGALISIWTERGSE